MQSLTVISERQACALVGVYRSTLRYQSRLPGQADGLSARIVELAQER
jgi:putative transposase